MSRVVGSFGLKVETAGKFSLQMSHNPVSKGQIRGPYFTHMVHVDQVNKSSSIVGPIVLFGPMNVEVWL